MASETKPDKRPGDPFEGLPRRVLYADVAPADTKLPDTKPKRADTKLKPADTKRADAIPKAGRPALGKPWETEGVSRVTWFRRQKAAEKAGKA